MTPAIALHGLARWPRLCGLEERLRRAAAAALATAAPPFTGELSVTFLPDEEMGELNRTWLGRSGPTDVIAFGLEGPARTGDVYVAPETAARNARELGIDVDEELARLVIHGVLHVLGHDHPEGDERYGSPMYELQEELLKGPAGR
ncbi:MAG: rRNA maturation RNase YbeY [Gemmatimonadota bacterium]|nr:rRNA maturation RNase YbeY [Gemmatimonadota bacterium]